MREAYTKVIADKHEDSIAKFGAILAQGIIDAGECRTSHWVTYVFVTYMS